MSSSSPKQKISLFLLGIFLTFIILEIALRIGGAIFTSSLEKKNRTKLIDSEFRILCIGESTTAIGGEDSYPSQLEQILQKKHPQLSIKIINKGEVSKNTSHLLSQLPGNLKKYRPHLVVMMTGINDRADPPTKYRGLVSLHEILLHIRVYKLLTLLSQHIHHKIMETNHSAANLPSIPTPPLTSPEIETTPDISEAEAIIKQLAITDYLEKGITNPELTDSIEMKKEQLTALQIRKEWLLIKLGNYYRIRKEYANAEKILLLAISLNPTIAAGFLELGRCHLENKAYDKAIPLFSRAISVEPNLPLPYIELGRSFDAINLPDKTFAVYQQLLTKNPDLPWYYNEIGEWLIKHEKWNEAENVYLSLQKKSPDNDNVYTQLFHIYSALGKKDEANKFASKASTEQTNIRTIHPMTKRNYNAMIELIQKNGAQLICMQYPLREIEVLTKTIEGNKNILFVENKKNFEEALKQSIYPEYFSDNFAINFGHCTRKGNKLIAENLADTIDQSILKAK